MNPIAAPKTLRYEPDAGLPVAIEAKSNRRYFYPSNGQTFSPTNTNVVRMTLNANSFLDFSHSYLQFTVTNSSTRNLALDHGVPFFNRLQIMSGGQELEDIQEYSRLYSMLTSIQGSRVTGDETSLTSRGRFGGAAAAIAAIPGAAVAGDSAAQAVAGIDTVVGNLRTAVNGAINNFNGEGVSYLHNDITAAAGALANGESYTYSIPIISAFFNIEKYFPLLLTEQGIDLYFYLEQGVNIGCWDNAIAGPDGGYKITEVKYVAHEVNLDDAFVNQMKSSMQATGGVLSLASTTYRYNQVSGGDVATAGGDFNISCRVKSLKGMLVRPQLSLLNNNKDFMSISTGQALGIKSAQFRIGSVLYPQSAMQFNGNSASANKGEFFNEIRKCFGTIGSYAHGTMLNDSTFRASNGADGQSDAQFRDAASSDTGRATANSNFGSGANSVKQFFTIAYDFETFAKSATESGLNVADRALPVSINIVKDAVSLKDNADANLTAANGQIRLDTFAMCDCIIYIDLMGKITTRI